MHHDEFKPVRARNLLFGLCLTLITGIALLAYFRDQIITIYFHEQVTPVALLLNGIIVGLFLLGIVRTAFLLGEYWREEASIARFAEFIKQGRPRQSPDIYPRSIIAKRYVQMVNAHRQGMTPDHAALSQIMVAEETIRGNTPRYINNILILTGVFGTIVSLSIALFGTSNLLDTSSQSAAGINMVIYGMSTALSTTMTAIVCYAMFAFFFLRTNIVRTHILAAVERITVDTLVPRFRIKADNTSEELAKLIAALQDVALGMVQAQQNQHEQQALMQQIAGQHADQIEHLNTRLEVLQSTLQRGFRL